MPNYHSQSMGLFVYGTLAPGRSNAHILEPLQGTWEAASIYGILHEEGWGATDGFPAVRLGGNNKVAGLLFQSPLLNEFLPELDLFEGEDYRRVEVDVMLDCNIRERAFVYSLNE